MSLIQYQSPFIILDLKPEEGRVDKRLLKLSKKRLLAEFQLHNSVTIKVNDDEFDKNAILKLFQELESDAHLDHHIRIFNTKHLLSFLESGDLQSYDKIKPEDLAGDSGYVNFTGLYFSNRFNEVLTKAIKASDIDALEFIFDHDIPADPKFHGDCFQGAYRLISGKVREITTLTDKNREKYVPESFIVSFIRPETIKILNALPEYFSGLKDRYGLALRDLAISVYNDHKRAGLSKKILRQGLFIDSSDKVKSEIQDILNQLKRLTGFFAPGHSNSGSQWSGRPQSEQKSENGLPWAIVAAIVFTVMGLFRTCDPGPSSSNYNFRFQMPKSTFETDMSELLMDFKVDYGLDTDFFDKLDSASSKAIGQNDVNLSSENKIRPKTGDQPYETYFENHINQLFVYKSFIMPRGQIVFNNKGDNDCLIYLTTTFGVVDHYYLRSQETLKLDSINRIESLLGFNIWVGNNWDSQMEIIPDEVYGGFQNRLGWISMPMDSSSIKLGVGIRDNTLSEVEINEITFSRPETGYERTVTTRRAPKILH